MSAKVFPLPQKFKDTVPDAFKIKNYQEAEEVFIKKISTWLKLRNSVEDSNYIGETIKFPIADGAAVYAIASLKPLQLVHLPLLDGYQAPDVDLMTAKRVKEKVDTHKSLQAYFDRVPEEADIQEAIDRLGIEATKMSNAEIKEKCYPEQSWTCSHFHVRWGDITYLIPRFNHGTDNHEVFKYLVNKCKATLIE